MKIAFTSCCSIGRPGQSSQPVWGIIHAQKPDLVILLGDNVYIGKDGYAVGDELFDTQILEDKYRRQLAEPHFNKLLCDVPYLAVWDNHDFGLPGHSFKAGNPHVKRYGAEVSTEYRNAARDLFNRYLKYRSVVPYSEHVYCSYTVSNIKFIMLDVRSLQQDPDDGADATLLGACQEEWLMNELESSTAEINVICSGIPYAFGKNGWKKHKNWFRRFNKKLKTVSKPIFLGGNIHSNEFKQHRLRLDPETVIAKTARQKKGVDDFVIAGKYKIFYEVISSGVGQNYKISDIDEPDPDIEDADNDDTPGTLPQNNYGIIDITNDLVKISLYGQKKSNIHYAEIKRRNWKLNTHLQLK